MSTDVQLKGDSRRRQLDASRAYAEAHDLELAESSELEDIGISAFKGANVREGALGRFLEAIQSGLIKPGSYLLVESLDRLSRQQLLAAQSLFLSIIQAGINLVTLIDGHVYKAGTNDLGDLIVSLVIMSRAHDESLTKSLRLSAAWKNKRTSASALKPMTKWCPAWLELSPDRTGYVPIPERVETVHKIFADSAAGIGIFRIAGRLNDSHIPTFNESNGWHQSYVAKILSNRAVLGEFQPGTRRNGKRVIEGDPVKNYFPAIIDEDLFYRSQHGRAQRTISGAGRKGIAFTNLFSGLATCAYCKAPMTFENKGRGAKGGNYLICSDARRGLGCDGVRWRYRDFEASFLAFVREIDFAEIIDGTKIKEQHILSEKITALEGELSSVTDLMEKTFAVLQAGGPVHFVTSKLNELQVRRDELTATLATKTLKFQETQSHEVQIGQSKDEIKTLVERLQNTEAQNSFELRAKVASQLKLLLDSLSVGTCGEAPKIMRTAKELEQIHGSEANDVVEHLNQRASDPQQSRRYFAAGFRDNRVRIVFPHRQDPLRYEQQVVANPQSGIQIVDKSSDV